ncbi:hypothetical protein FUA23_21955 [Neolewinella aurantiaca]|uniref:Uncharacterized protein n=1 Tax=Neolewinella aurantiaca TaxID=2602767 RepID=A0A5C7FCB4_9BACT|nr:hypothetical protein [Neolewinella aurantiaca]TXF81585.1 hypothetical protein FUA23_21955 [Neolewinella aurantiaca]
MKAIVAKFCSVLVLALFCFIPAANSTGGGAGNSSNTGCPGDPACGMGTVANKGAEVVGGKVTCTLDDPCKCCQPSAEPEDPGNE